VPAPPDSNALPEERSIVGRLAGYAPDGAAETADVARVRELLARTDDPWPRALPLHVTASALIVHPASGRVLLRWHPRQQAWLHVGGHGDPGEGDPLAIALREADEETGLTDLVPWPDDQIRQLAIVSVPPSSREPAHEHADVRFILATGHPEAARPETPDSPLRWVSVQSAASTPEANMREAWHRVQALLEDAGRPAE
jgi:8-oxo-dGTP pyrophosphatase MutT (NUDIX family)